MTVWVRVAVLVLSLGLTGVWSQGALAVVSYNLSGSSSESFFGYQKHRARGLSAGVNLHLGSRFQVGATLRNQLSKNYGYREVEEPVTEEIYLEQFDSESQVVSGSLNLQVNLYLGQTFVPFVFAGLVRSYMKTVEKSSSGISEYERFMPPGPQGGAGLLIRMSRTLSLRLQVTASPGSTIEDPETSEETPETNTYTQIGISYRPY